MSAINYYGGYIYYWHFRFILLILFYLAFLLYIAHKKGHNFCYSFLVGLNKYNFFFKNQITNLLNICYIYQKKGRCIKHLKVIYFKSLVFFRKGFDVKKMSNQKLELN